MQQYPLNKFIRVGYKISALVNHSTPFFLSIDSVFFNQHFNFENIPEIFGENFWKVLKKQEYLMKFWERLKLCSKSVWENLNKICKNFTENLQQFWEDCGKFGTLLRKRFHLINSGEGGDTATF